MSKSDAEGGGFFCNFKKSLARFSAAMMAILSTSTTRPTSRTSAYNQNCARCHGLEAISGGIAPDLRELEASIDGDEWFKERVINGAVRDGAVYMPRMADHLSQEALWAIRTYIESRAEAAQ